MSENEIKTDNKKYTPEYAPGEILVWIEPQSEDVAKALGEALGYELKDYIDRYGAYLFKVPVGEEEEACERFERVKEFVESASKFDVKLDKRFEEIEQIRNILNDLEDYAEDDEKYFKKIEELEKRIENLKKI